MSGAAARTGNLRQIIIKMAIENERSPSIVKIMPIQTTDEKVTYNEPTRMLVGKGYTKKNTG